MDNVTISRSQIHSPITERRRQGSRSCIHCPQLDPYLLEIFEEIDSLIEDGSFSIIKSKFSPENPDLEKYIEALQVQNPSLKFECNSLLHLVADKSNYECIQLFLDNGADPNLLNRKNQLPLHTVVDGGDGCHCPSCNTMNAKCVELLLSRGSLIDVQDWEGDTPLAAAALCLMDDCARVLWEHGASLNIGGKRGLAGEIVASYIPDEVANWLNAAIKQDEKEKLDILLNFGVLLGTTTTDDRKFAKETQFLTCMTKSHHKAKEILLLQPLVQAYLHLKWQAVSILFHILRMAYLGLVLLYTCFIFSVFLYNCPYEVLMDDEADPNIDPTKTKNLLKLLSRHNFTPSIKQDDPDQDPERRLCEPSNWIYFMTFVMIGFVCCMLLNELYEVNQGLRKYLSIRTNYGWWLMIITVSLNLVPVFTDVQGQWQFVVAAFGIFLAWGMFLIQLARDPKMGIYVEMLGRVILEFSMFAVTYFTLIVGFTFGFTVLFRDNPMFEFEYGFLPFVKSLLMMNGETDYETLFDLDENPRASDLEYAIGAHIMFVGFIAVMTIVLMNLLLGLAVSDIQELKNSALLSRTTRLIEQIDLLETLMHKPWMPFFLKSIYLQKCSMESQCNYYNEIEYEEVESELDDEEDAEDPNNNKGFNNSVNSVEGQKDRSGGMITRHGPYFYLSPLLKNDKSLPPELKEQFIDYLDIENCSKSQIQNNQESDVLTGNTTNRNEEVEQELVQQLENTLALLSKKLDELKSK